MPWITKPENCKIIHAVRISHDSHQPSNSTLGKLPQFPFLLPSIEVYSLQYHMGRYSVCLCAFSTMVLNHKVLAQCLIHRKYHVSHLITPHIRLPASWPAHNIHFQTVTKGDSSFKIKFAKKTGLYLREHMGQELRFVCDKREKCWDIGEDTGQDEGILHLKVQNHLQQLYPFINRDLL